MQQQRLPHSIVLLLCCLIVGTGCSNTNPFHYDYQGRLLTVDGKPAAGTKVYVNDAAGLGMDKSPEMRADYWKNWGTTTDSSGEFRGAFNNGHGDTYSKWLGLLPVPPPAAELDGVYVVVNRSGKWTPIFVKLDAQSQKYSYEGGRHLELPAVVLPSLTTQPPMQK